jgi:hypothetical protein
MNALVVLCGGVGLAGSAVDSVVVIRLAVVTCLLSVPGFALGARLSRLRWGTCPM